MFRAPAAALWLASAVLGGVSASAQTEPPHPILSIPGSGSGANTVLTTWTEAQYTNNFTPRLAPRNDDYGFCPPVVSGDTGWSWSASAPNQITSTPSGTVFPNTNTASYPVRTQAVTVFLTTATNNLTREVSVPYYNRADSTTAKSLVFNLIAYHQRRQLRSDLNKLAPAYVNSGSSRLTRNDAYARRIAVALLDWARWHPSYTLTAINSATFINVTPNYLATTTGFGPQRASDHNGLAHEWADDELLAFDAIYDSVALTNLSVELGFDVRQYIRENLFFDEGDFLVNHIPVEIAIQSNLSGPYTVLALVARVLNRPDYIVWMDAYLNATVRKKIRRDGALSEGMGYSIGYINENENAATHTRDYFTVRPADTPQLQAISNRAGIYVNTLTYGQQQWSRMALPNGQLPSFGDTPFNTYFPARNTGLSWLLPAYGTVSMGTGSGSSAVQLNQNFSGDNNHMRSDVTAYTLWAFGNEVLGNVRYHNGTPGRQFTEQILAHNAVTIDRSDMSNRDADTDGNGDLTLFEPGNNGLAVTEVDGQRIYSSRASRYQRILVLNTVDLDRPYVMDVFRVTGGKTHDYVWHGSIRYDQTAQCSFPLVTNSNTYPMLEGGEVWTEPTSSGSSFPYYGFWRNVSSNTAPGDFQIKYLDADRNSPGDVKLWMTTDPLTYQPSTNNYQLYLGRTPVPSRANGEPANWWVNGLWRPSAIIRKRIPSGTLQNLFVSVIEPLKNGAGTIQSVERLPMNGNALESCALKITFTDGRVDTCIVNLRNPQVAGANTGSAMVSTTNGQFSMTGRVGLLSDSQAGKRAWLVNGTQFSYPGGGYAPTNLFYSGAIIAETRRLTGGSHDAFITTTPLPAGTALRGRYLSLTFGTLSGAGTAGISEMFLIDQVIFTNNAYHICFTNDHQLEITNVTTTAEQMGPLRTFTGTNRFEIALSGLALTTTPATPTGLNAVPGNTRVWLGWNANGSPSYNVYRSTTNGGPYALVANTTASAFTDTGLQNGTAYHYVVAAVNDAGEGSVAAEVSATPIAIVSTGVLARYTFDDNTADDSSGYGHHGTLAGTAAIISDPERGKVLSLDGAGGKVDLGNPATLNVTGAVSVAAWVKPNSGMTGNHGILQRGHQSNPSREFVLRVGASGTSCDFGTWSPGQYATHAISAGDFGSWIHLAGVMEFNGGSYTYRLYRNGTEVASYSGGPGLLGDFTVGWAIGARGGIAGFERVFNGAIDDLLIFGRTLSIAEVQALLAGLPPKTSPHIASSVLSNGALLFSGTNGLPGATYQLLTTTNIVLPVSSWSRIATNQFDAQGQFNFSEPLNPETSQRFYLLLTP